MKIEARQLAVLFVLSIVMRNLPTGEGVIQKDVDQLRNVVSALARQVMLQQLSAEEKIRGDGASGIKQIRVSQSGPRPYYSNSHTGRSIGAIHDHSNRKNMLGQGEGQFVLNGVEFRTRHNDYLLRMPSNQSTKYNVLKDLPYPDVPPQVTAKQTVQEQIKEMRLWFQAWRDQDSSVRDYRAYFRPVLCYLEGAWTSKDSEVIEEPFFSDRHSLDADTWFDLQEKVRFAAYTGRKNLNENFAYLPTALTNVTESGQPVYAQWNYRMLCHPVSEDLPTSRFQIVDDLSARLPRGKTLAEFAKTRSARFELVGPGERRFSRWSLLDSLMSEIPGKDNYPARLSERSFGLDFLDPVATNNSLLNVGYYHRMYRVEKRDAMGLSQARRGFSDPNVFMAENTQSRIAPMYVRSCRRGQCASSRKRMSYAIPLEIVYLTPLTNWNPYKLKNFDQNQKKIVTGNGKRNGRLTEALAYNGTHNGLFYRTPTEFFTGGEIQADPADTVKGSVGVLDEQGRVRRVSASGIRIFLPSIPGVGVLRQRYPIVPVHGEGSAVWKELNAMKDMVMRLIERRTGRDGSSTDSSNSNGRKRGQGSRGGGRGGGGGRNNNRNSKNKGGNTRTKVVVYTTSMATSVGAGHHSHTVEFSQEEIDKMKGGQTVQAFTSQNNGHSHRVRVRYANNRFQMTACDGGNLPCWDGHTSCLMAETENSCPS